MIMKTKGLHPYVMQLLTKFIQEAKKHGFTLGVCQGVRTFDEQNDLYKQGRTVKGKIVTNAKGGDSFHNYSLAFDIVISLDGGKTITWDDKYYIEVSKYAPKELTFGGNFRSIKDYPHYQFDNNGEITIKELKAGYKLPQNYGQSPTPKPTPKPTTTTPTTPKTGIVNTELLNCRADASPNAEINGKLKKGTKLNIYAEKNGFYLVNKVNPQWVSKQFITLN